MTEQIHNGIHALREETPFVEWWYFNFVSDNDYVFNFLLHSTDVFGGKQHNYMSVSMITPFNDIYYFKRELDSKIYSNCKSSLNINSDNLVLISTEKDNKLHIKFKCKFDQLILEGCLKGTANKYFPNEGLLYEKNNKNIHWIIPIPNGDFNVRMTLYDNIVNLNGNIYHDHDWGTLLLEEAFNGWIWMHIYFKDKKGHMTMHNVIDKNGNEHMNCILMYENQKYSYKSGIIGPEEWKKNLTKNFQIDMIFNSKCDKKLEIKMYIENDTCDIIRQHTNDMYKYYRRELNCDITIDSILVEGIGIYEHLVIF